MVHQGGCKTIQLQRQWGIINTVKQVLWEARNIKVYQKTSVDLVTLRRRIQNLFRTSTRKPSWRRTAFLWKYEKIRTWLEQSGGWTTGRNSSCSPPPTQGTQKPLGTNNRAEWTLLLLCFSPLFFLNTFDLIFPTVVFLFFVRIKYFIYEF